MFQEEQVVALITTARAKSGFFSTQAYTLVLTDQRLILIPALGDELGDTLKTVHEEMPLQGGDFQGALHDQFRATITFENRYLSMSVEDILAESPTYAIISPEEVRRIWVESRSERGRGGPDEDRAFLHIGIETAEGKHEFNTDGDIPSAERARTLLTTLFGSLVSPESPD
jgi:hypothetical protein